MEQVNRHALPILLKIEAELGGEFSENDEVFYEVAGLINGVSLPGGRAGIPHLYPDEVKSLNKR